MTDGFVYFLRCGDFVKIGFSTKPKIRVRSLQTSTPFDFELLGVHPGHFGHERRLHEMLAHYRHRHEWFVAHKDILEIAKNGLPYMDVKPPKPAPNGVFNIFDKLGGESSSLDIITAAEGKRPSAEVVGKWKRERRIPALRAVMLLDECGRRGIAASYREDCILADAHEAVA